MFQLTTSRRGRLRSYYLLANLQCFNSRPHEEVDIPPKNNVRCPFCFNSRPHEEVDVSVLKVHTVYDVSTHDLTKRSTSTDSPHTGNLDVSTHDLTKRSTLRCLLSGLYQQCFNSRPHEEVDVGLRLN